MAMSIIFSTDPKTVCRLCGKGFKDQEEVVLETHTVVNIEKEDDEFESFQAGDLTVRNEDVREYTLTHKGCMRKGGETGGETST
jgi:hypothetical protein